MANPYDTKQKFARGLRTVDDKLGALMNQARDLVLSHPQFVGQVTEVWERWRPFKTKAAQELDKMFGDWDEMGDTLDLYAREVAVYETAIKKKLAEKKAEPPKAPRGRTPGRAPRRKDPAIPTGPQPAIVPIPPREPEKADESSALPRTVKQNLGPIAAAVAVAGLVLFAVTRKKR